MNKLYHTSDTAEAAYLIMHDCHLVKSNRQDGIVEFILQEPSQGKIGELLTEWETPYCGEHKFFKTYRWLLSQIKGGDNGRT